MAELFKYEKPVKIIYAMDVWTYHLMVYVMYGHSWDALPSFSFTSFFWIFALVSWTLWICMVLLRPSLAWNVTLTDAEFVLWVMAWYFVNPVFFYYLASYSHKWVWFIGFIVYRGWALYQMMLLLGEIREKSILLRAARNGKR